MKIAVTTASGVEAVTKRELFKLGIDNPPAINGRMVFEGDEKTLAECNIHLSTASRVYIWLAEFKCADFDALYDNLYQINWEDYLFENGQIIIEPKLVASKLTAFSATQSVAKKAVCARLMKSYKKAFLPENGPRYTIELAITHDYCTVLLNSSGESLHKRGYRYLYGEAQLKETLASAMIELSVWNPSRPLVDLFTGTGTIAIEAALKEKNIPVGLRRKFDFFNFKNFDQKAYESAKSEAISRLSTEKCQIIHAYDVDEKQLSLAKAHAKRAGVLDIIEFHHAEMQSFKSKALRGVAFANPPYGERLEDRPMIEKLYKDYGAVRRANPEWCYYTITPVTDFEKLFGARADKKRKLYNGRIECCFYSHLAPSPKKN
ncbi:MAG: class I SAM-dependent RNA methyltransferase [Clostridia bacterium]|nr:class I SAM-dependent RNA methyltransferase [Clostridia bacterium]